MVLDDPEDFRRLFAGQGRIGGEQAGSMGQRGFEIRGWLGHTHCTTPLEPMP